MASWRALIAWPSVFSPSEGSTLQSSTPLMAACTVGRADALWAR
jgi:hypothetical protein